MCADKSSLIAVALDAGAHAAAVALVADIPFRREFRAACEQNTCGRYGRCWMCPPDVGDIDAMMERAKGYRRALVYQTIGRLEDSFDIEGMESAAFSHNVLAQRLAQRLLPVLGEDVVKLGAGACHVCARCARMDERPCRYPERAIASLESYGIAVSELAALCGLNYINGSNSVTYFGAFLYN